MTFTFDLNIVDWHNTQQRNLLQILWRLNARMIILEGVCYLVLESNQKNLKAN